MNNEITVKLNCDIKEICQILKSIGFQCVEHYLLDDTYYIPNTIDIKKLTEKINHRGPDHTGIHKEDNIEFAFKILSIMD